MGAPQNAQNSIDLFKTLVFDPAVRAFLASEEAPLLAIPVVGVVAEDAEMEFIDALYDSLGNIIVFESVLFVDAQHRQAFENASVGLKAIVEKSGVDSQEFKDAHAKELDALQKFVQFGIAQPTVVPASV